MWTCSQSKLAWKPDGLHFLFHLLHTKHFVNAATSRSTNYVSRREIHKICFPGILAAISVFLETHRLKINNMWASCMWKPLTLSTRKLKRLVLLFGWLYFGKLFSKHYWVLKPLLKNSFILLGYQIMSPTGFSFRHQTSQISPQVVLNWQMLQCLIR